MNTNKPTAMIQHLPRCVMLGARYERRCRRVRRRVRFDCTMLVVAVIFTFWVLRNYTTWMKG
jgi:hypothetical protein